ncbi:glycosyl transferase [Actinoplanes sp. SE50]|uniref:glycosyltransferase family 2 protein n=1 Tax=unclassified Actinoplanes TaxID=2626549 RepID=UPI00023EDE4E|nr:MULTISPECIES: glycosyltransferase family A protein [unclassified Actinoplanes]AEV88178.1 Polypeptide N-acetylgalactosaminyltransferase 5 [Actinoplanes sp. SE50/110]ATO86583.1 glycosyl transferase [Actinoplanes sp. SE50]SLM04000.1 glycosyl transferase [Actinoplanes sp. SE50/110]
MRTHITPGAYGSALLDRHLRSLRKTGPDGPATAALRARSADARALLAYAAGVTDLDQLLSRARAGRPLPDRADPWDVGELARVIALQDLEPEDRADGLALFDALLRAHGPAAIAPAHQGLHVQLAFPAGRAADLLERYRAVPRPIREALAVDLAAPSTWLTRFNGLLPAPGIALSEGAGPRFDRIRPGIAPTTAGGTLISTIVTTYRPEPALLVTIRSLIAQSWPDQEILIVDDGSPDTAILDRAAALDPRIRVLRMPVNGGTYLARNAALDAAAGEFVTFQDSDDWSHPLRLERQVAPLLADRGLVAVTSAGMRVTGDLVITRPGHPHHRTYNLSSLMIRREPALERLGYLDTVRKGADAEYVERARAVFGRPAVQHLGGETLALIRLSGGSLSSADQAPGWLHPARQAYLSACQAWHTRIVAGREPARRPRTPQSRAFAAPALLTGTARPETYDLILAGDFTAPESAGPLRALTGRAVTMALLHLPTLDAAGRNLDPEVQRMINLAEVRQVFLADRAHTRLLVVRGPAAIAFAAGLPSGISADHVVIEHDPDWSPAAEALTAASIRLFGVEPVTVPLPCTVDPRRWQAVRTRPAGDRPILGRATADGPDHLRTLRRLVRDAPECDVRVLDRSADATTAFGRRTPLNWLVYREPDVTPRGFLHQIDFYLGLGDPPATLLPALAAGCVLLLPPEREAEYGSAAVYCTPDDLHPTMRRMHRSPERWAAQSGRGRDFARRHHHGVYADAVLTQLRPAELPKPRTAG